MTDLETTYVDQPDIPAGLTIAEYRRLRQKAHVPWWRRVFSARAHSSRS
jgi:hypothetical protein